MNADDGQTGHAYRCFCSPQRLQDLARQRQRAGLPTEYDRACWRIPREEADDRAYRKEKHVIRLKVIRCPDIRCHMRYPHNLAGSN